MGSCLAGESAVRPRAQALVIAPVMKHVAAPVILALALALSACIPSVQPFFTAENVVSDPALPGAWRADDNSMTWIFEARDDQGYRLRVTEEHDKHGEFNAHLFRVGGHTFLDLIPADFDLAKDQGDLVGMAVFPGHLLVRVTAIGPSLDVAFFNWDWLREYLKANPQALRHHVEDDRVLLTAETPELQQFVLAHLGEGELFSEVGKLARVAAESPSPAESAAPAPATEPAPAARD